MWTARPIRVAESSKDQRSKITLVAPTAACTTGRTAVRFRSTSDSGPSDSRRRRRAIACLWVDRWSSHSITWSRRPRPVGVHHLAWLSHKTTLNRFSSHLESADCLIFDLSQVSLASSPLWSRSPCAQLLPFICQQPACVEGKLIFDLSSSYSL